MRQRKIILSNSTDLEAVVAKRCIFVTLSQNTFSKHVSTKRSLLELKTHAHLDKLIVCHEARYARAIDVRHFAQRIKLLVAGNLISIMLVNKSTANSPHLNCL